MNCLLPRLHGLWLLVAGLAAAPAAPRDALSAVQVLREGGCGGIVPAARPLRHDPLLDQAARQWSEGRTLPAAAQSSGYLAGSTAGVHVSGPDSALLELLMRSGCGTLTSRALREIGVYRRGPDVWLVLAPVAMTAAGARAPAWSMSGIGPSVPTSAPAHARPSPPVTRSLTAPAAPTASRALQLINEVRARGTRCGERSVAAAPPVRLSETLAGVALGHAADMAENNYFEHEDLAGQSPADRVRAVGYAEKLVGENIAYGPGSVEEAVEGWLDSPGHCENIMDPRFREMGVGYASGSGERRGLYWVQLLAAPRD
jgi:uncharacterized protein YkwD